MEITKDIYKILGNGNVYVILKPEFIVIDTSDAVDSLNIKTEIEKIVPVGEVKKVLLTHLHFDHAGNVNLFPNAEVYASEVAIENYNSSPKDFFFNDISAKSDEILRNAKALPDEISGMKVLKVPGHTRGSVAFLDEERKLLFSGDTIFDKEIVGRTDLPNSIPDEMAKSVEDLKKLVDGGYKLCPGHDY